MRRTLPPNSLARVRNWWRNAVVYQVYPRSFADSDGDGVGDLPGLESKLDYLADLGVDVVWLSPVYRSPQDDNGYDISDYYDVEPMFGTLADMDRLIDGLHRRGMKLVMDLVANHTSDEHPWFAESRSGPDNAKRDWYWWRPGRDGGPPNNWGSIFSGSAWEPDGSGDYYLHLFSRKQPDLNWENPQVRRAVHSMMNWWLDRGVDGFRMDVINLISKDPALPDGPVSPGEPYGDAGPHVVNGPRVHEYLQEMHQAVFGHRDTQYLTVAEAPGVSVGQAVLFTDPQRREVDMVFTFEHMDFDHGATKWEPQPVDIVGLKQNLAKWQHGLADRGWNSLYWCNHDQPRIVSRYGDDGRYWRESATALATVLHLHRGTPYVYQGEEIGMTNYPFTDIEQCRDIEALNHYRQAVEVQGMDPQHVFAGISHASRDNARTPMQWSDAEQAGFTTGTPWIAANPNYTRINVASQRDDPDSVLHHYRRLIALRHDDAVVRDGAFELLLADHPALWVFTRTLGDEQLLVAANISPEPVDVPTGMSGGVVIANYPDPSGPTLRPWEARVLRREVG